MNDLFEKETLVLEHARAYLASNRGALDQKCIDEFQNVIDGYSFMLRQLRWMTKVSDMTVHGLNSDKLALLIKVNIDALTEVYNRRFLVSNLGHHLETLSATGGWITVIMMDIDFFKLYNDYYGHPSGDLCLRQVATSIRNSLTGAEDFVVRYGGEEFLAVLPGEDEKTGRIVAQRILNNIRLLDIPHQRSTIADHVTISAGLVSTIPSTTCTVSDIVKCADEALYLSKQNGRDRFTVLQMEEKL